MAPKRNSRAKNAKLSSPAVKGIKKKSSTKDKPAKKVATVVPKKKVSAKPDSNTATAKAAPKKAASKASTSAKRPTKKSRPEAADAVKPDGTSVATSSAVAAAPVTSIAASVDTDTPVTATSVTTPHVPVTGSEASIPDIDVVISFDTTGSMAPCINQVRKHVQELVDRLFTELPNLRIGIVAHGDYDHAPVSYLMTHVDLTDRKDDLIKFMRETGDVGPGTSWAEAYEYVLREVQKFSWRPAAMRALVMIGDSYPHELNTGKPLRNPYNIDWKHECDELKRMNIAIYAVQCLHSGPGQATKFYQTMAEKTSGYHLFLDQFNYVRDMILAVCIRQCGEERLTAYEQELKARPSGMTYSMRRMFDTMLGRKPTVTSDVNYGPSTSFTDLRPCPPSKYQVLEVDTPQSIKAFVQKEGLTFKTGKGFYEFTKPEQISAKKEIVLMKKSTGELFEGAAARAIAGITSANETKKVAPGAGALGDYRVFVQSTSYNRGLVSGSGFLYEAEDYGRT